jgi:hypothetical protein
VGSWADYLTANPGAAPASALGVYATDLNTRTVWVVVNHNSDFAAVVVPEPSSVALAAIGIAAAGLAARRRKGRTSPVRARPTAASQCLNTSRR